MNNNPASPPDSLSSRLSSSKTLSILILTLLLSCPRLRLHGADAFLFQNAIVHTVSGPVITNGGVLVRDGKIVSITDPGSPAATAPNVQVINLEGKHLYPGLIALDTALGLTEIETVRATRDASEVGDFTPDVLSWVAVNPDSELIPVARANGIACFQPTPRGNVVAGQSALLFTDGWTYEQMIVRRPVALHVYWPSMELNTSPRERSRNGAPHQPLEEQAIERQAKLKSVAEFFAEARAYAKAADAATSGESESFLRIPAWDAMLPYVQGKRPVFVHANEIRQIRAAVTWAATNQIRIVIAGGRDAAQAAELLAEHNIPVLYESVFIQPVRDTDAYDLLFCTPELLRRAGVKVALSFPPGGFATSALRNLPYAAAQAVAFGLPENEAIRMITLHPAELMGVADQLGSIEPGKSATLFVCDGNLLDLRSNVTRMWIAGREVSLENRHTRLHHRYRNRPAATP